MPRCAARRREAGVHGAGREPPLPEEIDEADQGGEEAEHGRITHDIGMEACVEACGLGPAMDSLSAGADAHGASISLRAMKMAMAEIQSPCWPTWTPVTARTRSRM